MLKTKRCVHKFICIGGEKQPCELCKLIPDQVADEDGKPKVGELVWITSYALTTGVYQTKVRNRCEDSATMIFVDRMGTSVFSKPDWHATEKEAYQHVISLITQKEKSIAKQLDKLKQLRATAEQKIGQ